MRIFFLLGLLLTGWGCQVNPAPPLHPDQSAAIPISHSDAAALNAQLESFLAAPDLNERLERLLDMEKQVLQLAADEPLKLGSLGSAILDIYPGSQTGHYAMSLFYDHVDSYDAKAVHEATLARIQAHMAQNSDGSAAAPYKVLTINDAHTFARTHNTTPVGSIYQIPDQDTFGILVIARPENGLLEQTYFDISDVFTVFRNTQPPNPWSLMRLLAARMDSAAQTTIGRYLGQMRRYEDAVGWLRVASRSGNLVANTLLARIYLIQAEAAENQAKRDELRELAMENHLHAIALGSTDSMYTLANLYLGDYYGEENRTAAIPLLRRAGELGHAESLLYLGYLYTTGREVEQDQDKANGFFAQAAALNNTQAILSYGRFLSAQDSQRLHPDSNDQARQWLRDLATRDNPEAMVILGNLHARGIGAQASYKKAVRWYKKAVKAAPDNADIVNEVAWTLTVSDLAGLKRAKFAKRIMDNLMNQDEQARSRPEYLDTWAAAHAASGDFTQAIVLQEQAIEQATSQEREDVLKILRGHLEQFKAGATITEKAP